MELIFRKRVGVFLLFVLLCATGVFLVSQLPVQLYPRTSRPTLSTSISHDGYSAIAFSDEYGAMVESNLLGIPGVETIEATYGTNRSSFTITFNWNTDSTVAQDQANAAIDTIGNSLPDSIQGVSRARFSTGENAGFAMIGLSSATVAADELYQLASTNLEDVLNQVPDVDVVELLNVEGLDAEITLDHPAMLSYGITIVDVDNALRQTDRSLSVGSLGRGFASPSIRIEEPAPGLFDIGETVVREDGGVPIRLEDIAEISVRYTVPNNTFVMEGTRGIQIVATPVEGGNIRNMSDEIFAILSDARSTGLLPADTEIEFFLDPAAYINRSITNVVQAALIGAGLAMLIVLLTLGEFRNTLLIGISLPTTLMLSFILLYAFNVSLNLISLGGLALAVGMIVDSSIVVMENIHRFREEEEHDGDALHLKDLIIRAVQQVRAPIIASTLTSILVFLPISFTSPLTNAILGEQSLVVVCALAISLVVALLLIPLVAFVVYRRKAARTVGRKAAESPDHEENIEDRILDSLGRGILDSFGKS